MSAAIVMEYLKDSKALSIVHEFLRKFNGIDLDLLDEQGNPIPFFLKNEIAEERILHRNIRSAYKTANNLTILPLYIEQATRTLKPVTFACPEGFIKILVPIVFQESVIGYLYSGENTQLRLNKSQLESMCQFLEETINRLVSHDFKFLDDFKGKEVTHQKKILFKVIQFLNSNYHIPELSLASVSEQNNVSYYYLSHLFTKELKTTFSNFLNNRRITVASRLLRDKSLSVSQVSYSCGFEDPGYFSKVFKKFQGVSPAEYRSKPEKRKVAVKTKKRWE